MVKGGVVYSGVVGRYVNLVLGRENLGRKYGYLVGFYFRDRKFSMGRVNKSFLFVGVCVERFFLFLVGWRVVVGGGYVGGVIWEN